MSDTTSSTSDSLVEGSTAYYVVRFSPEVLKKRQTTLFKWADELQRIAEISDPGVARLKLDWWSKELSSERIGESRHPLTIELHHHLVNGTRLPAALFEMIAATENSITEPSPASWNHFWARHGLIGGNLASLLAMPYSTNSIDTGITATAGAVIEATQKLQTLGYHLRRGEFPFPRELVDDMSELLSRKSPQTVEQIITNIEDQMQQLQQRPLPGPVEAQVAITTRVLKLLRDDPVSIYDAKIDLTPVQKLWIVWRKRSGMRQ